MKTVTEPVVLSEFRNEQCERGRRSGLHSCESNWVKKKMKRELKHTRQKGHDVSCDTIQTNSNRKD